LTGDEAAIFDGGYMLGEKARTLGLIDGFGDVDSLVKELGGDKAKPYWLRPRRPRGLLRLITRGAVESLLDVAEEKIMTPRLR
jgi:ClpP class serine protease